MDKMITVSTSTLKGNKDVFSVLRKYHKMGINAIELGSMHSYISDLSPLFRFKKEYDPTFIVHCFFPPAKRAFMLNIASSAEKLRDDSMKHARKAIGFAQRIGSGLYTIHPGVADDGDFEAGYQRSVESLEILSDYAREHSVDIAVENSSGSPELILNHLATMKRAMKDMPHLRFLIDIGHLKVTSHRFGFSLQEYADLVSERITEFHIHENDGTTDQHLPLKKGEVLSFFDRSVLKKAFLTLEGQDNWSMGDIRSSISFLESRI